MAFQRNHARPKTMGLLNSQLFPKFVRSYAALARHLRSCRARLSPLQVAEEGALNAGKIVPL